MPQGAAAISMKLLGARVLRELGYRRVLVGNTVLLGGTIATFALVGPRTPVAVIVVLSFLQGFFSSLQFTSLNSLVFADVPDDGASRASTISSTAQQLSLSVGVAVSSLVVALFVYLARTPGTPLMGPLHQAFAVLGLFTAVSGWYFVTLRPEDGANVSHHVGSHSAEGMPCLAVAFRHQLSETSVFSEDAEIVPNLNGPSRVLVNSIAEVGAKLSAALQLGVAFTANLRQRPGGWEEGHRHRPRGDARLRVLGTPGRATSPPGPGPPPLFHRRAGASRLNTLRATWARACAAGLAKRARARRGAPAWPPRCMSPAPRPMGRRDAAAHRVSPGGGSPSHLRSVQLPDWRTSRMPEAQRHNDITGDDMSYSSLPNVVAMVASLAAMAALTSLALRMSGGQFAAVLKLVTVGVFFSVFLHAGAELAEMFDLLGARRLMNVMGILLSVGSVAFCAAGVLGVRALR
jgi:hypothetical protein